MKKTVNMAILGAGGIARVMAKTINGMDTVNAFAVASRDLKRAQAFQQEFGFEKAYGSYEEMLADPDIELVYIATPHSHHALHAIMCLKAGKHVLCEKAFTTNAKQAREVLELSKATGLYVGEAIWPRYMPMTKVLQDFVAGDKIGKISALYASLGYPVYANARINDPELSGGALLDVGIYPLTFASIMFGDDISKVIPSAVFSDSGVDVQNTIILQYKDGRTATIFDSVIAKSDRMGLIYGDKGYAVIENINNFESLKIYNLDNKLIETVERPAQITGFEYEVQASVDAIRGGKYECPQMPHSEIIHMMELMDCIRREIGLVYPCEK